ncbi:MAG: AAA family ATPase [Cyanobacteria bacterium]|nr:AAA family ATPase [Cyanobacteriota bacterium]
MQNNIGSNVKLLKNKMIKIYLVGVSCIGKSTIGKLLARELDFVFYDFDKEIEKYFGKPIEYIRENFLFSYSYREETRIVLRELLNKKENLVIASCPSGLRDVYLREYKKSRENKENTLISIHISDKPENILRRITFYDKESRLLKKKLSEKEKRLYLKDIKKEITFFKKFNNRADYEFNIEGLELDKILNSLIDFLNSKNEELKRYISLRIPVYPDINSGNIR